MVETFDVDVGVDVVGEASPLSFLVVVDVVVAVVAVVVAVVGGVDVVVVVVVIVVVVALFLEGTLVDVGDVVVGDNADQDDDVVAVDGDDDGWSVGDEDV